MTFTPQQPVNLTSKHFTANQSAYYQWLRDEAPVCKGKMLWMNNYLISNYEDCNFVLKDPRFVRNRSTATGGKPHAIPHAEVAQVVIEQHDYRRRSDASAVKKSGASGLPAAFSGKAGQPP